MRSLLLAAIAALGLGGCYADYYEPTPGVVAGGAYGTPAGVNVSVAPPPPQYEEPLSCGYGSVYIPGQWDWNGSWYWTAGNCSGARAGYLWIPPVYANGIYIRGYWGTPQAYEIHRSRYGAYYGSYYGGGAYYGSAYRGGYVPPPAPAYRGGYAAPAYRGGYAAPAPAYRGGYVPAPAPAYRGGVAAPAPAYRGGYVPAPAAAYRGGVAPAPAYRAAPAPAYRGAPARGPAPAARAPAYHH